MIYGGVSLKVACLSYFLKAVRAWPTTVDEAWKCMVNDMLLTPNKNIQSSSDSNVSDSEFTRPITTSSGTSTLDVKMAYCATFLGIESTKDDTVTCRGFCRPIPTICVGEGATKYDRYCYVSNYEENYSHLRIYRTDDELFKNISVQGSTNYDNAKIGGLESFTIALS